MATSLLLLFKFAYDIVKRLIHDAYFRALGSVLLIMILIGTLFYWLAQDRTFLKAVTFSACTLAMNSPYGLDWGPKTVVGVVFHIIYQFFGIGLFLLFVLEAGKTMTQSYEEFLRKMTERKALKRTKKESASKTPDA